MTQNMQSFRIIALVNYVLKLSIPLESTVEFLETQKFVEVEDKKYLDSDIVLKIQNSITNEICRVPLEFQSSKDKNMGKIHFFYCLNNLLSGKGKNCLGKGIVFYTVLGKPKK